MSEQGLAIGAPAGVDGPLHLADGPGRRTADGGYDMVRVGLRGRPLRAAAVVAWSGDLPSDLRQVLFDTADAGVAGGESATTRSGEAF
jgi:hypothetical protein